MSALEKESGGRLGTFARCCDANERTFGYRMNERFAMCSTFKFLAAAAVLARVDAGQERMGRTIQVARSDLAGYSPVTEKHVGSAMTVRELCEAMMTLSDNTAANLLLHDLDGPAGLTRFLQSVRRSKTRLDRMEPFLNEGTPGDDRDTTTPADMAAYMQIFLLGKNLHTASRNQLLQWMLDCKTGDARIRAGLPNGWKVGDKTGTGDPGTSNDIAIAFPPDGKPLIICVYLVGSPRSGTDRNAIIAEAARQMVSALV